MSPRYTRAQPVDRDGSIPANGGKAHNQITTIRTLVGYIMVSTLSLPFAGWTHYLKEALVIYRVARPGSFTRQNPDRVHN